MVTSSHLSLFCIWDVEAVTIENPNWAMRIVAKPQGELSRRMVMVSRTLWREPTQLSWAGRPVDIHMREK